MREPIKCVYDGRTLELSYYNKKAVLVLLLVVCLSDELRVGTWTPSKVGLQPRRSMSHTHTLCAWLGGSRLRERERVGSIVTHTHTLWMQENKNKNKNNNILSLSLSLSLSL